MTNPSVTPVDPDDTKPLQIQLEKKLENKPESEDLRPPLKKLSVSNLSATQTDFSSIIAAKDNGNGCLFTNSKVKHIFYIFKLFYIFP